MKYYVVAGEKSGDLHSSNLMKAIVAEDKKAEFRFIGGDEMEKIAGNKPLLHYKNMAYMGFLEVILHLRTILGFIKQCKADIIDFNPDAVILVDYAGFNMKIAKFAKERGIQTHFYIAPKIWAWNQKRALKMKAYVDHLYTILPFEPDFYAKYEYQNVTYVGNPLMDAISAHSKNEGFKTENNIPSDKPILAILPGSRKYELTKMLPKMMEVAIQYANRYHIVIAGVDNLSEDFYTPYKNKKDISIVVGKTYDILDHAETAIVTSGTATLETALFNIPQVICYEMAPISAFIVKLIIKVRFVTLVNLIADKEVSVELLQQNFTTEKLKHELNRVVDNIEGWRDKMYKEYAQIKKLVGGAGASERTGKLIVERTKN